MVDEKKVALMTKLAIYEKKQTNDAIAISKYYKNDYVRYNVLKTWVAATVVFWTVVGFFAFMNFEDLLADINDVNYFNVMYDMLLKYALVCVAFCLFAAVVYSIRYAMARPGLVKYNSNLKDLIEMQGGPMHHAKIVKDSGIEITPQSRQTGSGVQKRSQQSESERAATAKQRVNKAEMFRQKEQEIEQDKERQIIENARLRNERIAAKNEEKQRHDAEVQRMLERRKQLEREQMERFRADNAKKMQRTNYNYQSDFERRDK